MKKVGQILAGVAIFAVVAFALYLGSGFSTNTVPASIDSTNVEVPVDSFSLDSTATDSVN